MADPLRNPQELIRRVYAYVAYRIGDGADAEDVTSETFERALRYRDSFDPRRGDPAAWLVGIARRCIADWALESRQVPEELTEGAIEGHEEESVRRLELRDAMAGLDDRDRELLSLRYGADLTARQIAELLELKTNAVEVALHRAVGRLRGELETEHGQRARRPNVRVAKPGDDAPASPY
jgi:RNA polymerase sigma-70 factor, ECF subfamily